MKLGIIVGHSDADEGAFSKTFNQSEYDWNTDLANLMLRASTPISQKIFFRDNGGISGAYKASDNWGSNITVELHFNSAHSISATGTAVLYYPGSTKGRKFAKLLQSEMTGVLGLRDWPKGTGGVVTPFQASGAQKRGMSSLSAGRAPATLLEPFFGSNPNDCAIASSKKTLLAKALVKAAERYFE